MKKVLKAIWDEFVYGGHLLALGLVCLVTLSAILLNIRITWDFAVVIYSLSLAPCLFGRYIDLRKDISTNPKRSQHLAKKTVIIPYIITFLILIMLGILIYFDKYYILLFGVALILLSFLYDIFFKKFTSRIIGFKNFFVGMLFSLLVVMLLLYYRSHVTLSFLLIIMFIYLMSFMGAVFSDIKDIESDRKIGLKTFAVVFGQNRLLSFLPFLILLAFIPIILGIYWRLLPPYAFMLLLVLPYNLILFRESEKDNVNADFLYGAAFDSQLIWWLFFVLIGKIFIK